MSSSSTLFLPAGADPFASLASLRPLVAAAAPVLPRGAGVPVVALRPGEGHVLLRYTLSAAETATRLSELHEAVIRPALERLPGEKKLVVVPGATHLFEEPGALEAVAELAAGWFERWLPSPAQEGSHP